MTELLPCPRCASPVQRNALGCPFCGAAITQQEVRPAAFLMLGLTVSACGYIAQPKYGAAVTDTDWFDEDGDGFSEEDGDCDDSNPDIHPEAEETPGDGVDSNCDGEDDT